MKTNDAIALIQTVMPRGETAKVRHLAEILGITVQAVYDWPNDTLPKLRVFELRDYVDEKLRGGGVADSPPSEAAA